MPKYRKPKEIKDDILEYLYDYDKKDGLFQTNGQKYKLKTLKLI